LVVQSCAFRQDARDLRPRAPSRSADARAAVCCRVQVRPARGARLHRRVWECKALNAKNWRALERDGLEKTFPTYAAQTALYQAYLNLTNPALFTAVNSDSCEPLHLLVPFNAERAQLWSDRAVTIIEATRAGELLPRGYDEPTDWHCRTCPHTGRCWR
jgi:hypothetical protein